MSKKTKTLKPVFRWLAAFYLRGFWRHLGIVKLRRERNSGILKCIIQGLKNEFKHKAKAI